WEPSVLSVWSCSNSLFLLLAAELSNLQARNFQTHPHLETTLRRLKSSQDAPLANQQLAPIHLETNEKKCLRRQGYFEKISVAVRNLVPAPLTLETIPETFQAVSRNAETLALQMKDLREFSLETIKKISLKRFSVSPLDGNA